MSTTAVPNMKPLILERIPGFLKANTTKKLHLKNTIFLLETAIFCVEGFRTEYFSATNKAEGWLAAAPDKPLNSFFRRLKECTEEIFTLLISFHNKQAE